MEYNSASLPKGRMRNKLKQFKGNIDFFIFTHDLINAFVQVYKK